MTYLINDSQAENSLIKGVVSDSHDAGVTSELISAENNSHKFFEGSQDINHKGIFVNKCSADLDNNTKEDASNFYSDIFFSFLSNTFNGIKSIAGYVGNNDIVKGVMISLISMHCKSFVDNAILSKCNYKFIQLFRNQSQLSAEEMRQGLQTVYKRNGQMMESISNIESSVQQLQLDNKQT
ncbi:hypothetical protein GUI12_02960 [Anaplasmataceae bacterium AB001_6]|nr:hypothetical protein GUI12_02960 [Anaplasmataceae bacterium AB001_6]